MAHNVDYMLLHALAIAMNNVIAQRIYIPLIVALRRFVVRNPSIHIQIRVRVYAPLD